MTTVGPIVFVAAVVVGFQMMNPFFLRYQGIISLVYSMSYFLVAACGLTFVIMTGSFDFSVPSLLKLSALFCVLYIEDFGLWVIPMALLICVCFGFINGVFLAKFQVASDGVRSPSECHAQSQVDAQKPDTYPPIKHGR